MGKNDFIPIGGDANVLDVTKLSKCVSKSILINVKGHVGNEDSIALSRTLIAKLLAAFGGIPLGTLGTRGGNVDLDRTVVEFLTVASLDSLLCLLGSAKLDIAEAGQQMLALC